MSRDLLIRSAPGFLRRQEVIGRVPPIVPLSLQDASEEPRFPLNPVMDPATRRTKPPTRWISEIYSRIGKCLAFGCNDSQIQRAAAVVRAVTRDWRLLMVGSAGYLPAGLRGFENHKVMWSDVNSFKHVDHVAYLRYAQSSRANWFTSFGTRNAENRQAWNDLMTPNSTGIILKSMKVDYNFPVQFPDTVSAYHKLAVSPDPTHTSITLSSVICSHRHRRIVAKTIEDIVIYDYKEGKPTTLPRFMFYSFRSTWRKQAQHMHWATSKIADFLKDVERLEEETWNRPGAVEDLGSAGKANASADVETATTGELNEEAAMEAAIEAALAGEGNEEASVENSTGESTR